MEMSGRTKLAWELEGGDFVTLTGYSDDAAEVVDVAPCGEKVIVVIASGRRRAMDPEKRMRLYQ